MEPVKIKNTVAAENRDNGITLGKTYLLEFGYDAESSFWQWARERFFVSEYEDAKTGTKAFKIEKKPFEPEAERVEVRVAESK